MFRQSCSDTKCDKHLLEHVMLRTLYRSWRRNCAVSPESTYKGVQRTDQVANELQKRLASSRSLVKKLREKQIHCLEALDERGTHEEFISRLRAEERARIERVRSAQETGVWAAPGAPIEGDATIDLAKATQDLEAALDTMRSFSSSPRVRGQGFQRSTPPRPRAFGSTSTAPCSTR